MLNRVVKTATRTAKGVWAVTCEAGASVLTYELYPLGVVPTPLPYLPKITNAPLPERPPVLFIHGVFHNQATFAWLKQRLAWAGWRNFRELNLFSSLRSIPSNAQRIKETVQSLKKSLGVNQVDIVAHSMGGILARYYVQCLGGDGNVRQLITLATPHQGTQWSRYSLLPHLRELSPESQLLKKLNNIAPPTQTQGVCISGDLDFLLWPRGSEEWPGVRNIRLKGVGHAGLLFSRRVSQILLSHLGTHVQSQEGLSS